jgi:nitrate/nitrite transporter NarK
VGQFYGRKSFGTLRGGVSLIPSLMSTIGPVAAGRVFDQTGSYSGALVGIAGTYILAGALFWVLKTPTKPSQDVT